MTGQAEIGLIGLGVMGQSLALNIADHGFEIAVYNRTAARTEAFAASDEASARPIVPCSTLEDLVGALRTPRAIILMVQAGAATDEQIETLAPLLEPGDVIVDGGNARYQDTIRRERDIARAWPAFARHRHLGRRGRRTSRPLDHGGRRGRGVSARSAGPRGDRRPGRRRAVLRPPRAGRRRALRQDDPQRHRVCRHAADRRDLRPDEGRPRPGLRADAGGVRGVERWRSELVSDRDHRRHSRQARSGDRGAHGRGDPGSGRAEGHRRLGGGRGARSRGAGADHRRGGRRAFALGGEGRADARREAAERAGGR